VLESLVLLASCFLLMLGNRIPVYLLGTVYSCVYVFCNSVYAHNIDRSVLAVMNLKNKPIKATVFALNCALYLPVTGFMGAVTIAKSDGFLVAVVCIISYQLIDLILLKLEAKLQFFFGSFLLAFIVLTLIFMHTISRG
jgi:hypothetical protein